MIEAIARAVGDVRSGRGGAVVTNPIHKKTLYDAGFRHPGHTEFLGTLSAAWTGTAATPVMMLAGPELKAVPVTIHIPLREVAAGAVRAADRRDGTDRRRTISRGASPSRRRASPSPGSIPHAGEGGALGNEDERIIAPGGRQRSAPKASTRPARCRPTACSIRRRAPSYDAAICMYHDQALIPAKTLAFAETVNVTLGLAFVRTSPDHGTALDIAGTGEANPSSLAAGRCGFAARTPPQRNGAHEPDRRPAAAPRGHRAPRPCRAEVARPELPSRPEPHRAHRPRRRRPRRTSPSIEVGPGPGGLTRALLAAGARPAWSRSSATSAASRRSARSRRAIRAGSTIVAGDALADRHGARFADGPALIVANLPYNIATPLLVGWLKTEPWPPWYRSMTLMFQREVAERIVAAAGIEDLWASQRARRLADRGADPLRHVAARLHAAAEGHLLGRASPAARRAARLRSDASSSG